MIKKKVKGNLNAAIPLFITLMVTRHQFLRKVPFQL